MFFLARIFLKEHFKACTNWTNTPQFSSHKGMLIEISLLFH